jgi:hypothetical protein
VRATSPRDAPDTFVHAATRSYIGLGGCPPPPEGREWVDRAARAGVLSPVVRALVTAGHEVPHPLTTLRAAALARHLRTLHDLAAARGLLDQADVAHAVLKGPVLGSVVFEEATVRDYTDLDLLVSPRRLRRAVEALTAGGATLLPTDWEHVTRARTAEIALELPHGTVLDLHSSLVNRGRVRDGFRFRTDDLLERRVTRRIDGIEVETLDDLDLVLHVFLHGCLSGLGQLRWHLDAQQCVTWLSAAPAALAERAAELGLTLPARVVLDGVVRHLDPRVRPWAAAMGRATGWTLALDALGRRRPPSSPSVSERTARTWYAATRATPSASWRSAAASAGLALRHLRSPWPQPRPLPTSPRDHGFDAWVRMAERVA